MSYNECRSSSVAATPCNNEYRSSSVAATSCTYFNHPLCF